MRTIVTTVIISALASGAWWLVSSSPVPVEGNAAAGRESAMPVIGQARDETGSISTSPQTATGAIAGRVVNQHGFPVAGVVVTLDEAVALAEFSSPATADGAALSLETAADGSFAFDGLCACRFRLRTAETARYSSWSGSVEANAGFVVADVLESRVLRVSGRTVDAAGSPLAGVETLPLQGSVPATVSDADGRFDLAIFVSDRQQRYVFRFLLEGFTEAQLSLNREDYEGRAALSRDIVLHRQATRMVDVVGHLRDDFGAGVVGERITLKSRSQGTRYQSESGIDGFFAFAEVAVAADYLLAVMPEGPYQDYTRTAFDVAASSLPLEISLESFATGRFSGRLVDPAGVGIADMRLLLRSRHARSKVVEIVSDSSGYFRVNDVPAGSLVLQTPPTTNGMTDFVVDGIEVTPGAESHFELTLDLGGESMRGAVVDENGNPISGALVELRQARRHGAVRSESSRFAIADAKGAYEFTDLAPGERRLRISAPGFVATTLPVGISQYYVKTALPVRDQ